MLDRKGLVAWAAGAALACAGIARADTSSPVAAPLGDDNLSLRPVQLQDTSTAPASAPTPPPTPLMAVLGPTPIGAALNALNITTGGFVEGSLTYSMAQPPNDIIAQNVFNIRDKDPVLDQLDYYVSRVATTSGTAWDWGFRGEIIYGADTATIHSSGLFDNPSTLGVTNGYYRSRTSPEFQFDVNQAYVNVNVPIGTGLGIQIGKFVTLLGYESINATSNPLFSHSYLFGYAIPFTQTGILFSYTFNSNFSAQAGITRGWNQTFYDNNGSPDFLGQVVWTPNDKDTATSFTLNVSEGPQTTGDNSDYWTVLDFIWKGHIGDTTTPGAGIGLAINADYGDAPHLLGDGGSAQWYGVAGYASYQINSMFTVNFRGEAYDDANGVTVALAPGSTQYYEGTLGVAITPFASNDILKNFVIRPEGRVDYSSHAAFDGGSKDYEVQLAVDAYFIF
jgi:Putative beta-barrel porin-2, OmpL-like. bbp2